MSKYNQDAKTEFKDECVNIIVMMNDGALIVTQTRSLKDGEIFIEHRKK